VFCARVLPHESLSAAGGDRRVESLNPAMARERREVTYVDLSVHALYLQPAMEES
jgi:hypothetical protein